MIVSSLKLLLEQVDLKGAILSGLKFPYDFIDLPDSLTIYLKNEGEPKEITSVPDYKPNAEIKIVPFDPITIEINFLNRKKWDRRSIKLSMKNQTVADIAVSIVDQITKVIKIAQVKTEGVYDGL